MSEKSLGIVDLRISNVLRVKAVHIHPNGENVVLSGKNGQGKSSVLKSIDMALRGERSAPIVPIHKGADKGEIVLDLGEIVVRRTYAKDKDGATVSALVVTNKDGARFPSPQAMLDKMLGERAFDPLEFSRMDSDDQAATLRRLLGLDFTKLDAEHAEKFATRTGVNRDGKALAARFDAMPFYPDAPAELVSSDAILAEQDAVTREHAAEVEKCRAMNAANDRVRASANAARIAQDAARATLSSNEKALEDADAEVARWTKIAADRRASVEFSSAALAEATKRADKATKEAGALLDIGAVAPDLAPFRARLASVEATNAKVRANKARAEAEAVLTAKRAESKALSDRLAAIEAEKARLISTANFPVPGLGFDANGVTLDGLPFDQASQAQQLRVSVAIGFALNPRLKVLLVKDASLLDAETLAMVEAMAVEAGGQLVLERVETDEATTVLIEDGTATEVEAARAEKVGA